MFPWIPALFLYRPSLQGPPGPRTSFQTGAPYRPGINIPADAAMVYGFGNNMPARVKGWRDAGYDVQLMTGVAWGEYQDYLYGRFDGQNHVDEAQTDKDGNKISHGGDVYYMSPGPTYGKFLAAGVRKALDVGVDAIYLEEPEFWVRSGYEPSFKRQWKEFYNEDWQAPDSSAEAQWRASKLKYILYRRALQQVFDDIQSYNREKKRNVRCYVATHSLLNYASWDIVSPESSLALLNGCDGYIAQVWTGTARTPNTYQGVRKERTFETAYLEYGSMMNVARATGKTMWFLADPVEDDPKHDWGDYRRNYEATVTASLLQPDVCRYEVMPWPERVFGGEYPSEADPSEKTKIPPSYATELQLVVNALEKMGDYSKSQWLSGSEGIGVVVSDTLMFERAGPMPSDPELNHIYGLALPFLTVGMPIQPVQLETATQKDLARYKLLVMTYRGMKPMTETADQNLIDWVRDGGILLFVDDDGDPFNAIPEWWNTGTERLTTPRQHLFEGLRVADKPGVQTSGKGAIDWLRANPADLAHDPKGGETVRAEAKKATAGLGGFWRESSYLCLQRGPYSIAWSNPESKSGVYFDGAYVNLFDSELKLLSEPHVVPGEKALLLKVDETGGGVRMLASAGKCSPMSGSKDEHEFSVSGIDGTVSIALLHSDRKPKSITLAGATLSSWEYDSMSHLIRVHYVNSSTPRTLSVEI